MKKNISAYPKLSLADKYALRRELFYYHRKAEAPPMELLAFLDVRKARRALKDNKNPSIWRIQAILGCRLSEYKLRVIRRHEKYYDMIDWRDK